MKKRDLPAAKAIAVATVAPVVKATADLVAKAESVAAQATAETAGTKT